MGYFSFLLLDGYQGENILKENKFVDLWFQSFQLTSAASVVDRQNIMVEGCGETELLNIIVTWKQRQRKASHSSMAHVPLAYCGGLIFLAQGVALFGGVALME